MKFAATGLLNGAGLRFGPGVALGFSLVSGRIFVRLEIAGLDLVFVVQHRLRLRLFLLGGATSITRPLLLATFQTSASVG